MKDNFSEQSTIYLVDGRVLLENTHTGVMTTVCSHNWNDEEATVICKQLAMGDTGTATQVSRNWEYSRGLFNVQCTGSEADLFDCNYATSDHSYMCDYVGDAGVNCSYSNTRMSFFTCLTVIYMFEIS